MLIIGWYLLIPKEEEFELPIFTPADLRATLVHPSLVGKTEHTIPNFTFINQDSLTITQDTLKEKIYVVDFFFTSCPSICMVSAPWNNRTNYTNGTIRIFCNC